MNEIINTLAEYERLLANPGTVSNKEELNKLLSDKFMEIGSSGRLYNREQTLKALESGEMPQTDLTGFNIINLAENTWLLTYRAKRIINGNTALSYRCSVWNYNNKQWQILFHQGTNITE
jgi:hypothetical protein